MCMPVLVFVALFISRWKEHFEDLLNRPVPTPPATLERTAAEAPTDDSVSIAVPTLMEVYEAIKKLKARKSPGVCGIHPEFIQYAGPDAMRLLAELFVQVWESEVLPGEWQQASSFQSTKARDRELIARITEASPCCLSRVRCSLTSSWPKSSRLS